METIETFVTASIHTSPKGVKFIRVRFQANEAQWLTAFNPTGVAGIEWVQRVSRTTGKQRIQSRFPITVRFQRSSVVGSDVVETCELKPRDFTPQAMEAADNASLAALTGAKGAVATGAMEAAAARKDHVEADRLGAEDDEPLA